MKKQILFYCLSLISMASFAQDYVAQSIGYNPPHSYNQENELLIIDDVYSDVVDIGFDFQFYGNEYSSLVVGTNGIVTFDISKANDFCQWVIQGSIPSGNLQDTNAIYGVFHDMDPSVDPDASLAAINFGRFGTAPNRRFVVNFYEIRQFSCNELQSTSQIVLYETTNTVEVYVREKEVCEFWNDGLAILGIENIGGTQGIAAPGRNASDGFWEANNEAWRFSAFQGTTVEAYNASIDVCDQDGDGFETFDLTAAEADVIGNQSGVAVGFYNSFLDANNDVNQLSNPYTNTSNPEVIFARVEDMDGLFAVSEVTLNVVACADNDNDGVDTIDEDLNNDGILNNDDTDNDGIPNYLDPDDDNDNVLTQDEITGIGAGGPGTQYNFIDTDNDNLENYLDNDDDGDAANSKNEDHNQNGTPIDDDINNNDIPDFLDVEVDIVVVLSNVDNLVTDFKVFPNPTSQFLNIGLSEIFDASEMVIYDLNGATIISSLLTELNTTVDVSRLESGLYFVAITNGNQKVTHRFIKK